MFLSIIRYSGSAGHGTLETMRPLKGMSLSS